MVRINVNKDALGILRYNGTPSVFGVNDDF